MATTKKKHKIERLIGFCGGCFRSNGVGKTTASLFLQKKHNFFICDPSKYVEKMTDNCLKSMSLGSVVLEEKKKQFAFDYVFASGRKISENFWLNMAIASIPKEAKMVVFDNVYFRNEAQFIKNNGGYIILITRNGFENPELDGFEPDRVVENEKKIEDFEKKIAKTLSTLYNE
jgi:hypothetical protein